jgi:heptosyltransferase-1
MRYNFLIIRWSGMGDIIMTLPAIKWLKDHFENCHISYLTDTAFAGIVEKSESVDSIAKIDRRGIATTGRFTSSVAGAISSMFRIRRKKINMAFDLQGFGETAIIAYLSGAPVRIGRIKGSPLRKHVYNSPILADWENEHRTRYFARTVAEAFGSEAPITIEPPRIKIKSNLKNPPSERIIGLNIGASTESRRWSELNFYELAKRLAPKGFAIRFLLGPQEAFLVKATKKVCRQNNWDFSLHRQIESLIKAVSECCLLISNDTGAGHLAAALDIPVVTLFSTGSPDNVRPLAKTAKWFRDIDDINRISVSVVEEASLTILDKKMG